MWERIKQILIKEFIQILRDPRSRAIIFAMPVVQVIIFGYAVTTDVKNVSLAIYDQDNSIHSREVTARFVESGYFHIDAFVEREEQIRELLDRGQIQVLLRFNKGFGQDLTSGRKAPLQMILDGTDSNTAAIILGYSSKIVSLYSREILVQWSSRLQGSGPLFSQINLESRAWFNENLESRNFFVPGVIALLVMLITLLLTSMAVVREKEIGTMEQIMVTPITPREFILGKTVPFILISFIDVLLISLVGVFWFEVPIRGNLALLFLATGFYIMSTLGVGLLISTISRTQQQAMMSAFFFVFPAMLLSGFIFPIANMPEPVQWLTYINPLRYFLVIIRGIFLKGIGVDILWPHMTALLIIGLLVLWVASKRFKKTMS
ncbi:MAG: ABC transporter permease [Deltaproteobacteria bacterium]|nr:ABC transporter permease [Deltaproteobacteria bacterium]